MRASNSSSAALVVVVLLASCSIADAQDHGPVKGTRAVIVTPYSRQFSPDAKEITGVRARAATQRTAAITDSKIGQRPVAFSTCIGARVTGTPQYKLTGVDDNGMAVSYELTDLDSLRVDTSDPQRTRFEVTRFPVVSPTELLKRQPSYTELRQTAEKRSSVWVSTSGTDGSGACLIEQAASDGKWIVFAHLGKLARSAVVTFGFPWETTPDAPIWWAIPSVVQDSSYPYRRNVPVKH
jgi:hypothetical protein